MYRVKTTIIESKTREKKKPHSFEVSNVELIEETAGQDGREGTDTHHPRYSEISLEKVISGNVATIPVTKLLQGVEKFYDSGKKLLDESVKVSEMERPGANVGGGIDAEAVESMGVRMGVRVVVDRTLGSRGAYNPKTGEVRVNPDAHKSMADLERTMAHEVVGHKGIHSLLGKSFDKVCERVSLLTATAT